MSTSINDYNYAVMSQKKECEGFNKLFEKFNYSDYKSK